MTSKPELHRPGDASSHPLCSRRAWQAGPMEAEMLNQSMPMELKDRREEGAMGGWSSAKMERYGWTMKDRPGVFMEVDKTALLVDKQYQRDGTKNKIAEIAKHWSWVACGCLIVASRPDMRLFVIDGQHRKVAADRRPDIKTLPCLIFEVEDVKQEAEGFLNANTLRKPMVAHEKFRALLMAGNPHAQFVNDLVSKSKRTIRAGSDGASVDCVSALMRVAQESKEVLARVWPIALLLCEGRLLHRDIIEGLCYIEKNCKNGASLMDAYWKKRVLHVGYDGLLMGARKSCEYHGKGGPKQVALGMVNAIHRGLSKRISGFED